MQTPENLKKALFPYGLMVRGFFRPDDTDSLPIPPDHRMLFLVGNAGPEMWQAFCQSTEITDSLPDPLDRWSQRVGDLIAEEFGGSAFYPFEGPPYLPFQRWTEKAEGLRASPLGLRLHPEFGLWHAYRFALYLPLSTDVLTRNAEYRFNCSDCADQPCLHTCPVNAFGANGYNTRVCANHLVSADDNACLQAGCLARHACPVGKAFAYEPAQARFHMQAFLRASESTNGS